MKPGTLIIRQLTFAVTDALMVAVAFLAAYAVRFYSGAIPLVHEIPPLAWYTRPLGIVSVVYVLFFRSAGLYAIRRRWRFWGEAGVVLHGATAASIVLMALTFLYRDASYSRAVLFLAWAMTPVCVLSGRWLLRRALALWLPHWQRKPRLLIVGAGVMTDHLIDRVRASGSHDIIGMVRPSAAAPSQGTHRVPVLGTLGDMPRLLESRVADEVVLADASLADPQIMRLLTQCEQELVTFRMVPDLLGLLTTHVGVQNLDGVPLLGLRETPLSEPWNRFAKRTLDLTVAAGALILTALLWVVIAFLIRRDSPGPVFFFQERVGQDGQAFRIMKFRTMRVGAEDQTGPVWTTPNDQRRTRIGRVLRRWNLDELPQLLNVLRGEMSLVGPRPERPHFVRQFKQHIPRYMTRHRIRSGLTGWAQIHGLRGDTSIEERTQYDLSYLENWSLWLDCKILWRSLTALHNAY